MINDDHLWWLSIGALFYLIGAWIVFASKGWDRSQDPVIYEYIGPFFWPISMPVIGIIKIVKTIKKRRSNKFFATARIVKR